MRKREFLSVRSSLFTLIFFSCRAFSMNSSVILASTKRLQRPDYSVKYAWQPGLRLDRQPATADWTCRSSPSLMRPSTNLRMVRACDTHLATRGGDLHAVFLCAFGHVDFWRLHQRVPGHHRFALSPSMSPAEPLVPVDHFTLKPNRPPPRAAFLSHVHKDHMVGLETYCSSFVYCSHATKEVHLSQNSIIYL